MRFADVDIPDDVILSIHPHPTDAEGFAMRATVTTCDRRPRQYKFQREMSVRDVEKLRSVANDQWLYSLVSFVVDQARIGATIRKPRR